MIRCKQRKVYFVTTVLLRETVGCTTVSNFFAPLRSSTIENIFNLTNIPEMCNLSTTIQKTSILDRESQYQTFEYLSHSRVKKSQELEKEVDLLLFP